MNVRLFFLIAIAPIVGGVATPAAATTTKCAIPSQCMLVQNTSSGGAILAQATSGYGIAASSQTGTAFLGVSQSGSYLQPGLAAENTNQTGSDAAATFGVQGYNNGSPPTYGALGYGSTYGLYGFAASSGASSSTFGYGVFGQDNAPPSSSDYNAGVVGSSSYGTGVIAESNGAATNAPLGDLPIGLYAIAEPAGNGESVAIEAQSGSFLMEGKNSKTNGLLELLSPSYLVYTSGSGGSFYVNNSGNGGVTGTFTTSKGTYARSRGASGTMMTEYGARTTAPTVEDVGQGQLYNGRGTVAIDAKLADVIDHRTNYLVFLTPEGDSNGLYVTQKSGAGFVVREQRGGRSTLTFDYRIIAKPVDEDGQRLPLASPIEKPAVSSIAAAGRVARPLTPQQRLEARIGPAAYAAAVRSARAASPTR